MFVRNVSNSVRLSTVNADVGAVTAITKVMR